MKTFINELDLINKTIIVHWNVRKKKDLLSFATKLIERIPDFSNTKEYYQSYLNKKTHKIGKMIKK